MRRSSPRPHPAAGDGVIVSFSLVMSVPLCADCSGFFADLPERYGNSGRLVQDCAPNCRCAATWQRCAPARGGRAAILPGRSSVLLVKTSVDARLPGRSPRTSRPPPRTTRPALGLQHHFGHSLKRWKHLVLKPGPQQTSPGQRWGAIAGVRTRPGRGQVSVKSAFGGAVAPACRTAASARRNESCFARRVSRRADWPSHLPRR